MPSAPITQDILWASAYAINATTAALFRPPTPTRIHRLTYIATTTQTTDTAIITLSITQADTTATSPTGATLGTMSITPALGTVNQVTYFDVQASIGDLIVYPGEALAVISDGGGAAGVGDLWLTVEALGFNAPDVRSHAIGGAHPGSTDLPTAFTNVTELTS